MSAEPLEIHIIADSTGETAARIARAAITQFPSREFTIVRHRKINKTAALLRALEAVRDSAPAAAVPRLPSVGSAIHSVICTDKGGGRLGPRIMPISTEVIA